MKKLYISLAVAVILLAGGCLCNQNSGEHTITKVSDSLSEFKSVVHGNYSFLVNSNYSYDEENSYDNSLMSTLNFIDNSTGQIIFVGVLPDFVIESGWMNESCNKDKMTEQLKSSGQLNITDVRDYREKNYTSLNSCLTDATALQDGVLVNMTMAFGECKKKLPMYAVTSGPDSVSNMETVLESFSC